MLILSSVPQGYLNKPCRIPSQSSNSPWTFFVDVVVRDLKDLRGEWLSSTKLGSRILFLRMIMWERLKKTEFCKRLRSVPCVAFPKCNQALELGCHTVVNVPAELVLW